MGTNGMAWQGENERKAERANVRFELSIDVNRETRPAMLKDISGEIRKQQWRETWQILNASPKNFIFGAGLSGYQDAA